MRVDGLLCIDKFSVSLVFAIYRAAYLWVISFLIYAFTYKIHLCFVFLSLPLSFIYSTIFDVAYHKTLYDLEPSSLSDVPWLGPYKNRLHIDIYLLFDYSPKCISIHKKKLYDAEEKKDMEKTKNYDKPRANQLRMCGLISEWWPSFGCAHSQYAV